MRGHPLLETFILGLLLACLALPLHLVTKGRAHNTTRNSEPTQVIQKDLVTADLLIRSAHPLTETIITVGGRDHTLTADQVELDLMVNPLEPIEVIVSATWPEGTPETALYIELAPENREGISYTIWGQESAFETLTFHWKGDDYE